MKYADCAAFEFPAEENEVIIMDEALKEKLEFLLEIEDL